MAVQQGGDTYYYDRAEAELEMAQRARVPEAVRAHHELANLYLDLFYHRDSEPAAPVVRD